MNQNNFGKNNNNPNINRRNSQQGNNTQTLTLNPNGSNPAVNNNGDNSNNDYVPQYNFNFNHNNQSNYIQNVDNYPINKVQNNNYMIPNNRLFIYSKDAKQNLNKKTPNNSKKNKDILLPDQRNESANFKQQINRDQHNIQFSSIYVNNIDTQNNQFDYYQSLQPKKKIQQTLKKNTHQQPLLQNSWENQFNKISAFVGYELEIPDFVSGHLIQQLNFIMNEIRTEIDQWLQNNDLASEYKQYIQNKFVDTNKDISQPLLTQSNDNKQSNKVDSNKPAQINQLALIKQKLDDAYENNYPKSLKNDDDQSDLFDKQSFKSEMDFCGKAIEIENSNCVEISEIQSEINQLSQFVSDYETLIWKYDLQLNKLDFQKMPNLKLNEQRNTFQGNQIIQILNNINYATETKFKNDCLLKSIIFSFFKQLLCSDKKQIKSFLQIQIKHLPVENNKFQYSYRILRLIYISLYLTTNEYPNYKEENLTLFTSLFEFQQIQDLVTDCFLKKIYIFLKKKPSEKNGNLLRQLRERDFSDMKMICKQLSISYQLNIFLFDHYDNSQQFQPKSKESFNIYIYFTGQLNYTSKKLCLVDDLSEMQLNCIQERIVKKKEINNNNQNKKVKKNNKIKENDKKNENTFLQEMKQSEKQ